MEIFKKAVIVIAILFYVVASCIEQKRAIDEKRYTFIYLIFAAHTAAAVAATIDFIRY